MGWNLKAVAMGLVAGVVNAQTPTVENCTMMYFDQPLDHFNGNPEYSFKERVCVYDGFRNNKSDDAILFYAGNEAPVDLYVNNTGLMWDLGRKLGAVLVFAEHRYFGESVPPLKGVDNCLSYLTSAQALADFATVVPRLKNHFGLGEESKVVSFGGSYGGMLAAWFRIKYPHICNGGAVAGSAPVFGFASSHPPLDGAFQAISNGAETMEGKPSEQCRNGYLGAWVLIDYIARHGGDIGRAYLQKNLRTCSAVTEQNVGTVIQTLQDVLFLLAESNFPNPSDYIVFSIIQKRGYDLPAWPMRHACKHVTTPKLRLTGYPENVDFQIGVKLGSEATDNELLLGVKWNATSQNSQISIEDILHEPSAVQGLVRGVADVYGMLYNITGEEKCFKLTGDTTATNPVVDEDEDVEASASNGRTCEIDSIDMGDAWSIITCNEGLNLVNDRVRGVGRDMYWPPSTAVKNYSYYEVVQSTANPDLCSTFRKRGIYGVTDRSKFLDTYGEWDYIQYLGRQVGKYATNIIFSNGRYDPWSAAGVLENQSKTVVSLMLEQGGHHTDFMFPVDTDPEQIREVRQQEMDIVTSWVKTSPTTMWEEDDETIPDEQLGYVTFLLLAAASLIVGVIIGLAVHNYRVRDKMLLLSRYEEYAHDMETVGQPTFGYTSLPDQHRNPETVASSSSY